MITESTKLLFDDAEHDVSLPEMPAGYALNDDARAWREFVAGIGRDYGDKWAKACEFWHRAEQRYTVEEMTFAFAPTGVSSEDGVCKRLQGVADTFDASKANEQTRLGNKLQGARAARLHRLNTMKVGKGRPKGGQSAEQQRGEVATVSLNTILSDEEGNQTELGEMVAGESLPLPMEVNETLQAMRDLLATLPDVQRRAIELTMLLVEPMTLEQAGLAMGKSIANVHACRKAGLDSLRDSMLGYGRHAHGGKLEARAIKRQHALATLAGSQYRHFQTA